MNMEDKESTDSGSPVGNSDPDSPPVINTAVVGGVNGGHGGFMVPPSMSSGDLTMKKRGRPRKIEGMGMGVASPPGFSISGEFSGSKRGRGKPQGGGNWQGFAAMGEVFANTAGADFIPHVVTVQTGEDVAGKLMSISQNGPRGICILSANGTISNVTIRQPGFSGGLLTYEGRFEILTLTGSFTPSETNGMKSRTGGLSISLAGPDGRVVGGGVAGGLLAASPIQVVFGSFMPNSNRTHKRNYQTGASVVNNSPTVVTEAMPISQATLSNNVAPGPPVPFSVPSRGEVNKRNYQIGSPVGNNAPTMVTEAMPISHATLPNNVAPAPFSVQSRGEGNNNLINHRANPNTGEVNHNVINHRASPNTTFTGSADYNNSGPTLDARHYPDINVPISFD